MTVRKKKDSKLARHGRAGQNALREKLGEEGYAKHMAKIGRRRWKLHPEQRAQK